MCIINNKERSVLSEGRNYQMGFAFLKKIDDNNYETVQPISPCKDYLNDVVWSENCGKPVHAYGLSYKKQNIFEKQDRAYLAISICNKKAGSLFNYADFEKDSQNLKENYKTLQSFMNDYEDDLGIERTEITEVSNNLYFVRISLFWVNTTYLISLWSLLMRVGQFYKGENSAKEFVETFKAFPPDIYILNSAKPKLEKLLNGVIPKQNFDDLHGGTDVHNCGIVDFNF